jgi:hypothetical protein
MIFEKDLLSASERRFSAYWIFCVMKGPVVAGVHQRQ